MSPESKNIFKILFGVTTHKNLKANRSGFFTKRKRSIAPTATGRGKNSTTPVLRQTPDENIDAVRLFPNPATDQVTVLFAACNNGPSKINVYNRLGQRVIAAQHIATKGANIFSVNIANLPKACIFRK